MDIFQLECFKKVAELSSGVQAAEQLNISQTTLSRTVSSLEMELGTKLFDRIGRSLVLNEHGKLFYKYVLHGLETLHYGAEVAKSVNKESNGYIGIGCMGFNGIMTECISNYCRENPHVIFRFLKSRSEAQEENRYLNIDILLNYSMYGQMYATEFFPVSKELFDDAYYFVISDKYKMFLEDKKVLMPEEMKDFTFVLMSTAFSPNNSSYRIWENLKKAMKNSDPRVIVVKDFAQKLTFLSNGTGAGFLTAVCLPFAKKYDPSIRTFNIQGMDLRRKIVLSRRRKEDMSQQSLHFWEYLLKFFNLPIDMED